LVISNREYNKDKYSKDNNNKLSWVEVNKLNNNFLSNLVEEDSLPNNWTSSEME
jgi:hypothetical protein